MKFRKIMAAVLGLYLLTSVAQAAKTPEKDIPVDVIVNGRYLKMEVPALLENGTVYAPIRFVGEALGAKIGWNARNGLATVSGEGKTIVLENGKNYAIVNGNRVSLLGGARIHKDRVFVPVRFISETLNAGVRWNSRYYAAQLTKQGHTVSSNLMQSEDYQEEILWMGRIVEAESAGEPLLGQVAVGNVILNRVNSNQYPNTIYGVIFDRKNGVQFEPILNGSIYNTPSDDSIISGKRALWGERPVGDCLFFFNPKIAQSNWISNNRPFYSAIGNHHFYL